MKAKMLFCTLLFSVATATFVSCSNDSEINQEPKAFNFKDGGGPIKEGGIRFTGRLFRGKRWSAKHNVKPCTQGFGLCNIGWEVYVKPNAEFIKDALTDASSSGSTPMGAETIRINFIEPITAKPGDTFISAEDDNIVVPNEVAETFGVKKLTILADDYVLQAPDPSIGATYGYVVVNVIVE